MRRLVPLLLIAAATTALVFAAIAIAAPSSGKWRGRVLIDAPGKPYDGGKVSVGYSPGNPAYVRFKVAKGGGKVKDITIDVPLSSDCGRGPPGARFSLSSAKISKVGKFKKTVTQAPPNLPDAQFVVKIRGKLAGSKGSGRFSVRFKGDNCAAKYKFKPKH